MLRLFNTFVTFVSESTNGQGSLGRITNNLKGQFSGARLIDRPKLTRQ